MTAAESNQTVTKYVYPFGEKGIAAPPNDRALLGGKGQGLVEMTTIGLPVPPGFIITTEACNEYRRNRRRFPKGFEEDVLQALTILENDRGLKLGDPVNPLLVSVRSGARVSMPGMMDTILNLGLNDQTVQGFSEKMGSERLAYDNYRRFIMMYSDIVKGISRKLFEQAFNVLKMEEDVHLDIELSTAGLKQACSLFKKIYEQHTGTPFIENVKEQLFTTIAAVFNSWEGERAALYRELHQIPDDWGTAVIVQSMVFGNKGNNSATGVAFTRDPATGENIFYGEFLINAQGEEVVAGIRTPHPINKHQKEISKSKLESLEELMPGTYQELHNTVLTLEKHYKDMQDIEFTIDDGKLFMLQTRTGKRTGFAAIRIALEMLKAGIIDEKTALKRIKPSQLVQLLAPVFDPVVKQKAADKFVAKGLNAGPGAASGKAAFSKEKALEFKKNGIDCILVREEANPDDFPGMVAAEGILTLRGGSTSHAAVVARGMGKPCVVGCGALYLNEANKTLSGETLTIKEGDPISIDGLTGEVFFCDMPTSPSEILQVIITRTKKPEDSLIFQEFHTVMELADKYRTMTVRANADNPQDAKVARAFGAEGVGLCRTEHMFMEPERLNDVRCMFFSTHPEERKHAIDRLLPYQKNDFKGIFRNMQGMPVTIRLLDPPLHEFMPHTEEELTNLSQVMGVSAQKLRDISVSLAEHNPMLGHRGCRLGITSPELTEMQTRAILEAAVEVAAEGIVVMPEIMVPLVGTWEELEHQRIIIEKTARKVFGQTGMNIHYSIGTMIELPRACLTADEIAKYADFFSFGTNDLTQTTYGISRDDSAKFVPSYIKGVPNPIKGHEIKHIFSIDPFEKLDTEGVGQLMKMAIEKARKVHPKLKCGICGEQAGEPSTVIFCQSLGLDYVSCSPYRVPIARLAAAWANLD